MRILVVSSEVAPLAKTGGLADMTGSLSAALSRQGHEVVIAVPYYQQIRALGLTTFPVLEDIMADFGGRSVKASVLKSVLPKTDVTVYLVDCPEFFDRPGLYQEDGNDYGDNLERFALFCQAILATLKREYWQPHVIHCNDWQTALIPIYLRTWYREDPFYNPIKVLYTIHNLAYQGIFPKEKLLELHLPWYLYHIDGIEFYERISLMKGGIVCSDRISTVSPRYAAEIRTKELGCGLEGVLNKRKKVLVGILNGMDYSVWSPDQDGCIAATYSARDLSGKVRCKAALQKENGLVIDPSMPVLGMISRLDEQKGLDILAEVFPELMARKVQVVLLGTGQPKYHKTFGEFARKYEGKAGIHLTFDNDMAHRIEAGADLFLMPSHYEPCGHNQMYSLRYGTIPVVRATGGLADTVTEYSPETGEGNGFVFINHKGNEFLAAIEKGLAMFQKKETWDSLMKKAMKMDFSWNVSARSYGQLYEEMVEGL